VSVFFLEKSVEKCNEAIWICFRTVVINDITLMKEALNDLAFAGRPDIKFFADRSGGTTKGTGYLISYDSFVH
jgi:hypothetical protein